MASLGGEQHREGSADAGGIERRLLLTEQILQALQAIDLDALLDLIAERGRRRARAWAELEGVGLGKVDLRDEGEGGCKIALSLSRKADDDVGGERHVRARGTDAREEAQVIGGRVLAVHGGENA